MENVYAKLEKIICSKVKEFENFLIEFQENFNGDDLKKVVDKKNELKLHCTDHVLNEFFSENNTVEMSMNHDKKQIYFRSVKYMFERTKELDRLFLEFLDKFIDLQVKDGRY